MVHEKRNAIPGVSENGPLLALTCGGASEIRIQKLAIFKFMSLSSKIDTRSKEFHVLK